MQNEPINEFSFLPSAGNTQPTYFHVVMSDGRQAMTLLSRSPQGHSTCKQNTAIKYTSAYQQTCH